MPGEDAALVTVRVSVVPTEDGGFRVSTKFTCGCMSEGTIVHRLCNGELLGALEDVVHFQVCDRHGRT